MTSLTTFLIGYWQATIPIQQCPSRYTYLGIAEGSTRKNLLFGLTIFANIIKLRLTINNNRLTISAKGLQTGIIGSDYLQIFIRNKLRDQT